MGIFQIIYNNLPAELLPVRLRKPVHKSWLRALVNGAIAPLYSAFTLNRNANVYFLTHNSQVCYMEAVLNDAFDSTDRRIFITDIDIHQPIYVYTDPELLPVYLAVGSEIGSTSYDAPIYLYTEAELIGINDGFVVHVPALLGITIDVNKLNQLKALVNKYRLPSKASWVIMTF